LYSVQVQKVPFIPVGYGTAAVGDSNFQQIFGFCIKRVKKAILFKFSECIYLCSSIVMELKELSSETDLDLAK
jgi:hypothetical protein